MAATIPHVTDIAAPTAPVSPLDRLQVGADYFRTLVGLAWQQEGAANTKRAVVVLEDVTRILTAIQTEVLTEIARAGSWSADGERTLTQWVSNRTGTSRGTAARGLGLAKALSEDLPETRDALAKGEISADHAQVIAREATKSDALRNKLKHPRRGEKALLEQAQKMNATDFAKKAKQWATQNDAAGADRQWRKDIHKEELHVVPFKHGTKISGWVTASHGALLLEALQSHAGRKAADDDRPYPERLAAGLTAMVHQSLNSGLQLPNARIRPQLTITLEYDTLKALADATATSMPRCATDSFGGTDQAAWAASWQPGDDHVIATQLDYRHLLGTTPATLPDGTPLAPSELARFACSSMLNRVIFGPDSTILDSGRDERLFTASQTKAIIARDRHCQYPGCTESPNRCEVHHSLEWFKHNGKTDANLGILLCWHHHTLVHAQQLTIARRSGTWIFHRASGHVIHPPGTAPPSSNSPGTAPPTASRVGTAPPDPRPTSTAPPNSGSPSATSPETRPPRIAAPTLWEPDPDQDPHPPF